jgi:hypothetical protein
VAAPLLEANANAIGPRGSRSVELIGADGSLKRLGGALVRRTELAPFGGIGEIVLPGPLARDVGVTKLGCSPPPPWRTAFRHSWPADGKPSAGQSCERSSNRHFAPMHGSDEDARDTAAKASHFLGI